MMPSLSAAGAFPFPGPVTESRLSLFHVTCCQERHPFQTQSRLAPATLKRMMLVGEDQRASPFVSVSARALLLN